MYSFSYIRRAFQKVGSENSDKTYCVSSIALGNNVYQYFKYYIRVEVSEKYLNTQSTVFHFLFQDASVQAFHNVGSQPWTGLDAQVVHETAQTLIASLQFKTINSTNSILLDVIKNSSKFLKHQKEANLETVSISKILQIGSGTKYYLATWLTKNSENPFLNPVMAHGLVISVDSFQQVQVAENVSPYSDFWLPLEKNILDIDSIISGDIKLWPDKLFQLTN